MKILFIALNSPSHLSIWNYLSIEALIGHINGIYSDKDIQCSTLYCNSNKDVKKIIKEINSGKYKLIGFSIQSYTLDFFNKIIKKLKHTNSIFLFGNQLPTYFPKEILQIVLSNTRISYNQAFCVMGEGEKTIADVIDLILYKILNIDNLKTINNIVYYNGNSFNDKTVKKVAPILSKLPYPPQYDLLKINKNSSVQMQLSRGCGHAKCSYCTRFSFRHYKKWESFSIERIEKDLKNIILNLKCKIIEFSDDEFFGGTEKVHIQRLNKILDIIENTGEKISYRLFIRPDSIYKKGNPNNHEIERILKRMKKTGLERIYIGIESGSCSQLKRYNRGLDKDVIIKSIEILQKLNIPFDCGFILFDPKLNLDELIESAEFYLKYNLIKGNQWFWRSLIINKGSFWGEDLAAFKIKKFNLNSMSYDYEIEDPQVRYIMNIARSKSKTTSVLFYALKQITKRNFSCDNENEVSVAKELVEKNGIIYVQLIRELGISLKNNNRKNLKKAIYEANKNLKLVIQETLDKIDYFKNKNDRIFLQKLLTGIK
ncbi:MAG: radical SAM protein [Deltaproteobacteria bacterium]|nr:radical SAM protein [Deltaproteobacteria bacterium]